MITEISNQKIVIGKNCPWIVMIHGFGGSKGMWKKQIEAFRNTYNLMIVELPGHGDSVEGISVYGDIELNDIAKAIIDFLHEEQIEKANFIAVSLGSIVLSSIVEICPSLVESVVLCGAVFGMSALSKLEMRLGNLMKYVLPYMTVVRIMASILMPRRSHKVSRKYLVQECARLGRKEFMKWYGLSLREIDRLKNNLSCFSGIRSLVVMGSEDYVFLKKAVKAVETFAGGTRMRVIENCGHVCSLQKWREFNAITASFFGINPTPDDV